MNHPIRFAGSALALVVSLISSATPASAEDRAHGALNATLGVVGGAIRTEDHQTNTSDAGAVVYAAFSAQGYRGKVYRDRSMMASGEFKLSIDPKGIDLEAGGHLGSLMFGDGCGLGLGGMVRRHDSVNGNWADNVGVEFPLGLQCMNKIGRLFIQAGPPIRKTGENHVVAGAKAEIRFLGKEGEFNLSYESLQGKDGVSSKEGDMTVKAYLGQRKILYVGGDVRYQNVRENNADHSLLYVGANAGLVFGAGGTY